MQQQETTLNTMKHIGNAKLAEAINAQLENSGMHAIALTKELNLQSTEHLLENPAHFKASYQTPLIEEFASYTNDQTEATVFVSHQDMSAQAIFDIGTPEQPKNRYHTATIKLEKTADYQNLNHAHSSQFNQRAFASWLEEHHDKIQTFGKETVPGLEPPKIELIKAINAVRNTKITTNTESNSKIEDLSEQKSVMASVEVTNLDGAKPIYFDYTCTPYHGLKLPMQTANQNDDENTSRTFRVRINTITDGEKPAFSLKIMSFEQHQEEMVAAFKNQLKQELDDKTIIRIGTFS